MITHYHQLWNYTSVKMAVLITQSVITFLFLTCFVCLHWRLNWNTAFNQGNGDGNLGVWEPVPNHGRESGMGISPQWNLFEYPHTPSSCPGAWRTVILLQMLLHPGFPVNSANFIVSIQSSSIFSVLKINWNWFIPIHIASGVQESYLTHLKQTQGVTVCFSRTFWGAPVPRWPGHRWPYGSACPRSRRTRRFP